MLGRRGSRTGSVDAGKRAYGTAWRDGNIDVLWAARNHAFREVGNLDALCDVVVA
jgi:hypothetical protein